MPRTASALGVVAPRGEKMKTGRGWRLVSPSKRTFKASLVARFKVKGETVAVFRVVVPPDTPEIAEKRSRIARKAVRTRKRNERENSN